MADSVSFPLCTALSWLPSHCRVCLVLSSFLPRKDCTTIDTSDALLCLVALFLFSCVLLHLFICLLHISTQKVIGSRNSKCPKSNSDFCPLTLLVLVDSLTLCSAALARNFKGIPGPTVSSYHARHHATCRSYPLNSKCPFSPSQHLLLCLPLSLSSQDHLMAFQMLSASENLHSYNFS